MKDIIELSIHVDIVRHIVFYEGETVASEEMGNVVHIPRQQIVHADHIMALSDEMITEMTAEETGPAGDERSLHGIRHRASGTGH
jgi:hypothetical protein